MSEVGNLIRQKIRQLIRKRNELIYERELYWPKSSYGYARINSGIACNDFMIEVWKALVKINIEDRLN